MAEYFDKPLNDRQLIGGQTERRNIMSGAQKQWGPLSWRLVRLWSLSRRKSWCTSAEQERKVSECRWSCCCEIEPRLAKERISQHYARLHNLIENKTLQCTIVPCVIFPNFACQSKTDLRHYLLPLLIFLCIFHQTCLGCHPTFDYDS